MLLQAEPFGTLASLPCRQSLYRSDIRAVRDGLPAVTDGPYLGTKEFLSSFCLIDVESEQRPLEIADRMPLASFRSVEVWPVLHEAGAEM
jgi:hypothetical protein